MGLKIAVEAFLRTFTGTGKAKKASDQRVLLNGRKGWVLPLGGTKSGKPVYKKGGNFRPTIDGVEVEPSHFLFRDLTTGKVIGVVPMVPDGESEAGNKKLTSKGTVDLPGVGDVTPNVQVITSAKGITCSGKYRGQWLPGYVYVPYEEEAEEAEGIDPDSYGGDDA